MECIVAENVYALNAMCEVKLCVVLEILLSPPIMHTKPTGMALRISSSRLIGPSVGLLDRLLL